MKERTGGGAWMGVCVCVNKRVRGCIVTILQHIYRKTPYRRATFMHRGKHRAVVLKQMSSGEVVSPRASIRHNNKNGDTHQTASAEPGASS